MERKRQQFIATAGLVLATAVAGVAARRAGSSASPPPPDRTSFSAAPGGPVTFRGQLDRTAVRFGQEGILRMELTMAAAQSEDVRHGPRRPTDLVIILDRSGSMSGEKIEQARAAVRELIAELTPQDRFALVTYSDDADIAVSLGAVDERAPAAWGALVAEIAADGGTNIARGLDVGLGLLESSRSPGRVPHVILISDGLATQGETSDEALIHRARRAARGEYMLSAVGVGADFNEGLMTALADAGTGNYYYLRHSVALAGVFARELDAARTTVAQALAVRIDPAAGVRVVDAAGYPLEPEADGVVFRPGSLFAGQERRVWVTLAVPQNTAGEYDVGRFSLSYGEGEGRRSLSFSEMPRVACVRSDDDFYRRLDVAAWSRSVTVDTYNKMQEEVAREVKAGRRDEALARLRAFKDETEAMNARLQSPPVAAQLDSAQRLEAEVSQAFEGDDQSARQNELSKSAGAAALDARRAGSKK